MSGDILISWDGDLMEGDFLFSENDLESEDGLFTAALISLFTDRRAYDDDVLPDPQSDDRRGWWGDLASTEVDGDQIGSRLWLLERSKVLPEILTRAEEYAREALEWMVEDGIAAKVEVFAERQGSVEAPVLALKVEIYKVDGQVEAMEFSTQWENMYS